MGEGFRLEVVSTPVDLAEKRNEQQVEFLGLLWDLRHEAQNDWSGVYDPSPKGDDASFGKSHNESANDLLATVNRLIFIAAEKAGISPNQWSEYQRQRREWEAERLEKISLTK